MNQDEIDAMVDKIAFACFAVAFGALVCFVVLLLVLAVTV